MQNDPKARSLHARAGLSGLLAEDYEIEITRIIKKRHERKIRIWFDKRRGSAKPPLTIRIKISHLG